MTNGGCRRAALCLSADESAVLLRQYIQQSLVSKATSGSTQLYDQ